MTKIFLITGFLGAGKSTYLNNQLSKNNEKVGVLINEFGNISVDTITLNKNGMDLIELTNGSIFCACLKDKFIDGLIELLKKPLDAIYIESSGLADPSNIDSIGDVIKKELPDKDFEFAGVICIVDALYFLKQIDLLESVKRQISHSHLIIINKTDLVDETTVDEIINIIKEYNKDAVIECAVQGKTTSNIDTISVFSIASEETTNTYSSRPNGMILSFENEVNIEMIRQFFSLSAAYLYRAKGYVNTNDTLYKIDIVNDTIDIITEENNVTIGERELNKIVLILKEGIDSIKNISKYTREIFGDTVRIKS